MITMMTIGTLGTRAPRRREADWIQLFVECCSRSGPRPVLYVPNMRVTAVGKAVMIAMMTMGTLGTHAPRRRKAAKRHTTHGENFWSSLIQIRGKKTEIKKSALVLFLSELNAVVCLMLLVTSQVTDRDQGTFPSSGSMDQGFHQAPLIEEGSASTTVWEHKLRTLGIIFLSNHSLHNTTINFTSLTKPLRIYQFDFTCL